MAFAGSPERSCLGDESPVLEIRHRRRLVLVFYKLQKVLARVDVQLLVDALDMGADGESDKNIFFAT